MSNDNVKVQIIQETVTDKNRQGMTTNYLVVPWGGATDIAKYRNQVMTGKYKLWKSSKNKYIWEETF